MPTAREDHTCCLCKQPIAKGSEYVCQELTPWSGNGNEVFWTYKAHPECDRIYCTVGEEFDWAIPGTRSDWKDYVEADEWEQKRKEGA